MARPVVSGLRSPYASVHVGEVGFTIGDEAADVINVALQLKNPKFEALGTKGHVRCYLAADEDGNTLATPPTTLAIGTNGLLVVEETSNGVFTLVSEDDGTIDIDITIATAAEYWLVVMMPDGSVRISDAITFAA
jgi:hypothetical protein